MSVQPSTKQQLVIVKMFVWYWVLIWGNSSEKEKLLVGFILIADMKTHLDNKTENNLK